MRPYSAQCSCGEWRGREVEIRQKKEDVESEERGVGRETGDKWARGRGRRRGGESGEGRGNRGSKEMRGEVTP